MQRRGVRGWVHGFPRLGDDGVEAMEAVGRVGHGADGAVGFDQRVLALDHVAVALLPLALVVARMRVVDPVVEGVLGGCLRAREAGLAFFFP